jgi:hypothetical protein
VEQRVHRNGPAGLLALEQRAKVREEVAHAAARMQRTRNPRATREKV